MVQTLWDLLEALDIEAVGVEGLEKRFTTQQLVEILKKWNCPAPVMGRQFRRKFALAKAVYDHALQRREPFELHEFSADWCQPCKSVARAFEKRKKELSAQLNVDEGALEEVLLGKDLGVDKIIFHDITKAGTSDYKLASGWGISSIPAFVVTRGKRRAEAIFGAMSIDDLRDEITKAKREIA